MHETLPDTNAEEESIGCQSREQAIDAATCAVRRSSENGEENEDEGRDQQSPLARDVITVPAEEELPHDGPGKGDGRYVASGGRCSVLRGIELGQHGAHGTNDTEHSTR